MKVRLGRWIVSVLILSIGYGLPASTQAQETPVEQFAEELDVVEVLLDVLVTDRSGQVIIGLGRDDFEVSEDGEPVETTGVTFYSSSELLGSTEELERFGMKVDQVAEDRYFIIFFQQQRRAAAEVQGLLGRQMQAARDLEIWIAEALQPRDLVAVVSYETRLEVVQDFTRNIEALQEGVRRAAAGPGGELNWPSRQPAIEDGPSLSRQLPTGKDLRNQTADIYRGLQVLARAAGSIRGRKNLIMIGRGIGETDRFGIWQPDARYYRPTIEALNDNNLAVYPLDVMPLGVQHSLENSLSAMAIDTGGSFTRQFTSFLTPLRSIMRENGGYYLLSYQSRREPGTSGFQKVKVETRNPELRVRARQGYLYGD